MSVGDFRSGKRGNACVVSVVPVPSWESVADVRGVLMPDQSVRGRCEGLGPWTLPMWGGIISGRHCFGRGRCDYAAWQYR